MGEHRKHLPASWTTATVGRVGSVRLGRQRSPDKHTGQFSTKYVRAANITTEGLDLSDVLEMDFTPEERERFRLRDGDVLLAEASGSASQVGRAALWREEIPGCCYQNTVIRFRPHATDPQFAGIVFRHYLISGAFARVAHGVGIQHLGLSRFAQMPFPLPPLAEQQRIAGEASQRLADFHEAKRSMESALAGTTAQDREIIAAAIAGDLVEPEATIALRGRQAYEDARALLAKLQLPRSEGWLFNNLVKPTTEPAGTEQRDRNLPPGWAWARVGQLGEVRLGKQLSPREKHGPLQRPYLRVANVLEDVIDARDIKRMHFSDEEYKVYRLVPEDLLLNEGQSLELVGRPAMYRGEVPGACFQNTLIRFRASSVVDPEYALLLFRHYLHSCEFQKIARQSTNIAHLGLQRFAEMPFPLPPLVEQHRIAAEARRRLAASAEQALAVQASLTRLPDMERELLEAAVSGTLVPQQEADEPADQLLARLGPPPREEPLVRRPAAARGGSVMTKLIRTPVGRAAPLQMSLAEVLREAGAPLTLPELFSRAGYDRDSTAEVEQFYLTLRAELGHSIRQVGSRRENALLEVIEGVVENASQ